MLTPTSTISDQHLSTKIFCQRHAIIGKDPKHRGPRCWSFRQDHQHRRSPIDTLPKDLLLTSYYCCKDQKHRGHHCWSSWQADINVNDLRSESPHRIFCWRRSIIGKSPKHWGHFCWWRQWLRSSDRYRHEGLLASEETPSLTKTLPTNNPCKYYRWGPFRNHRASLVVFKHLPTFMYHRR